MTDLFLPSTDGGVFAQFVVVTVGFGAMMWWVRRREGTRVFVAGLWLVTYGLMAVRAIH